MEESRDLVRGLFIGLEGFADFLDAVGTDWGDLVEALLLGGGGELRPHPTHGLREDRGSMVIGLKRAFVVPHDKQNRDPSRVDR